MHINKMLKPKRSNAYNVYWQFAAERNNIFNKRLNRQYGPWTNDAILSGHRFTNVFRASDRVSQYLIRLQYEKEYDVADSFFITILFKLFNRIETYRSLLEEFGEVNYKNFSVDNYDRVLTGRMARGEKVYSAAYIMPSAGNVFGHKFKHTNHLALITKMMRDGLDIKIANCKSLKEVYTTMLSYPSLGSFLAFQYTIDLNYSRIINFSEMDFVVAGPGAKNGIHKCFSSLGDFSYEDIIRLMVDEQEAVCDDLDIEQPTLAGRSLQLIDCQNIFCEVDKYLRVARPELNEVTGRTRIKQKYSTPKEPINFFFPPKWNINSKFQNICPQKVSVNMFS